MSSPDPAVRADAPIDALAMGSRPERHQIGPDLFRASWTL